VRYRGIRIGSATLHSASHHYLGGDKPDMAEEEAEALSSLQSMYLHSIGTTIPTSSSSTSTSKLLRLLHYPCSSTSSSTRGRISMDTRLWITNSTTSTNSGNKDLLTYIKRKKVGYIVYIEVHNSTSGTRLLNSYTYPITSTSTSSANEDNDMLELFKLQYIECELVDMYMGDYITVRGELYNTSTNDIYTNRLTIQLCNCRLYTYVGDVLDCLKDISAEELALRMPIYNDPMEIYNF
jgi:hypothetical protein